jgi:hypothetical protein
MTRVFLLSFRLSIEKHTTLIYIVPVIVRCDYEWANIMLSSFTLFYTPECFIQPAKKMLQQR